MSSKITTQFWERTTQRVPYFFLYISKFGPVVLEKIKIWKVKGQQMPSDRKSSLEYWREKKSLPLAYQDNSKTTCQFKENVLVWFMVFNATFNNILVISWRSVLLVEETGVPGENHWPFAGHCQTLSHITP